MKCNLKCEKKKNFEQAQEEVTEKLNSYTPEMAASDLTQFMKLHGSIEKSSKKAKRYKDAIISCEGTKNCK